MSAADPRRGQPPTGRGGDDDDADDPVVARYSVFIKPPLPEHRNLVVLQYVNKTAQDPAQIRMPRIAELRVKPRTGMYEVDVPIDTTEAYDRAKGIAWGTALQKSMEAKKGGSLGLAGGFNIAATSNPAGRGRGRAGADDDVPLGWAEAVRQDKILRTQTFGGSRSAEEENTRHMVGVFQGKNLHLTPVSSVVHLRPVPHHIDAATEQERLSRAPAGAQRGRGAGPGAGADKAAGRAIHMTIKSAMDEDGVATETMADRLRNVQTETWQRMEWVHDESELAWEAYNECLLLHAGDHQQQQQQQQQQQNQGALKGDGEEEEHAGGQGEGEGGGEEGEDKDKEVKSKGKGKERAAAEGGGDSAAADLVERVAWLRTDWGEQELLQAVSGVKPDAQTEAPTAAGKGKAREQAREGQQQQAGRAGRSTAPGASSAAGPAAARRGPGRE